MADNIPVETLYQRRCATYIYVIPNGLNELMADISREVLRNNPTQLCSFIADYLDALLITRENAKVACKIVDDLAERSIIVTELLTKLEIGQEEAIKAAGIIQRCFRRYMKRNHPLKHDQFHDSELTDKLLQRCGITVEQACYAAKIIQRAYLCYRARLRTLQRSKLIDWRLAAMKTIGIFRDLQVPTWEMERAATLLKASYKGYYVRRLIKKIVGSQPAVSEISIFKSSESLPEEFESSTTLTNTYDYDSIINEIQIHAAVVIQRAFRKHICRRRVYSNLIDNCFKVINA